MKKILTNKLVFLISVLAVLVFGALGAVAANAESETTEPQSSISQTADGIQSTTQEQTNEEKMETKPETEILKTYEDNSLNKIGSAETVLIILVFVLIVIELAGIGVLIVLILKKVSTDELTENRSK